MSRDQQNWISGGVRCGLYIVHYRSDCMLADFGAERCPAEVPEFHLGRILVTSLGILCGFCVV